MPADLSAVVLDGAARELVARRLLGRHLDLARDELDHLTRQVTVAVWEAAVAGIELQHQRERQPAGAALPRDQLVIAVEQRPVLNQLVQVEGLVVIAESSEFGQKRNKRQR